MIRFAPRCRAGAFLLAAGLSAASLSAQGASLPQPLELRVPKPPTVARAEGGSFLVYELHLTNLGPDTLVLKRVEVVMPDTGKAMGLSTFLPDDRTDPEKSARECGRLMVERPMSRLPPPRAS